MRDLTNNRLLFSISILLTSGIGLSLFTFLLGRVGLLQLPVFWVLIIPLISLFVAIAFFLNRAGQSMQIEVVAGWVALAAIWLVHFLGVLVPETGFDAVWYHLPVIETFLKLGKITYIPELYQSINPLLTDLIFLLGFQAAGELGTKVVAYGCGIIFLICCYLLAECFLKNQLWTIWFLVSVSLIQPVSWQVSSVYVDLMKAGWELASLLFILLFSRNKSMTAYLILAGFFLGAAVATKAFTLLMVPIFIVLIVVAQAKVGLAKMVQNSAIFLMSAFLIAAPFYFYTQQSVGTPFYTLLIHVDKLDEIGGESSLLVYLLDRVQSLPYAWWYIVVEARDYVSILLVLLLPIFIWQLPNLIKSKNATQIWLLLIFASSQLVLWWIVPPLSTRYAVGGFVIVLLLFFIATESFLMQQRNSSWQRTVLLVVIIATAWHLLPRLVITHRTMMYLLQPNKEQYLSQFYDGNIDHHLKKWHHLE